MILNSEEIKDVCSKILTAVDNSNLSTITETLELIAQENVLYLNVTNREYYVQIKLPISESTEFHATVNASVFLKLISQITTDTIELLALEKSLVIKGNGKYELPLIFEGEQLLQLPKIEINNTTTELDVSSDILLSILNYNLKELNKGLITNSVQRLCYIDEEGCITFTTGACVNKFNLSSPIKILLKPTIVKLFKLFKNTEVHITLGQDSISSDIVQTKIKFDCGNVVLTAIISCDESLVNAVPAKVIRNMATDGYPHLVMLNKDKLVQAINRLLLFSNTKTYAKFNFTPLEVEIVLNDINKETLNYANNTKLEAVYSCSLDLVDLKLTLETCEDNYVLVKLGNEQSIVISRKDIYNVIPEVEEI